MVHLAAIAAWRESRGRLPVNVKFIVEGEEEIGSEHLAAFLGAHRAALSADAIVLTDTSNLEAGLPSLTTRLRGLVKVEIGLTGYSHALHSGFWGGPVPDPVMGMSRLLASFVSDDGRDRRAGAAGRRDPRDEGGARRARAAAVPREALPCRRRRRADARTPREGRRRGLRVAVVRALVRGHGARGLAGRGLEQPDRALGPRADRRAHRPRAGSGEGAGGRSSRTCGRTRPGDSNSRSAR